MRKNLFLFKIVALLLAIGCKKTELNPQPEGSTGQLTFNTSISQLTKAIHGGIEYADETFGMFVYALTDDTVWETDKSLTNPIMGGADGTSAVEIALLNNEWRANDGNTYFWPSSSSTTASFFGYSPYRDAASTASPKAVIPGVKFTTANGVIFENYVNTVERAKVNDLMYTNAQLDKKYNSRDVVFGKLPVDFNHAMAQLVFTVKRFYAYPGVNIELQNITLKGLESKGTFSSVVAEGAKNWSIAEGNTLNYVVFNNTATPHNVIVTKTDVGDPHVMIPQDATSLTFDVTYKISGTGVATETFTKTIAFGVNLEMNKKTICNLVISLNDITFSPMIVEWDYQDSNYTDLPASSSTQKGINASLELLNQYKDELTKAGNTDQCFFTIDVPDGASGAIKLGFSSVDNFVEGDVISLHFSSTAAATSFVPMDGWSMSGSLAVATGGVISLVKTDFDR